MSSILDPAPTMLLPGLPPKTLVGIDLITFTSTPKFHGIRDLPDGWHFLYTGTTESLSLRSGAWFYVGDIDALHREHKDTALVLRKTNEDQNSGPVVYIWNWNSDIESLISLKPGDAADTRMAMYYKANLAGIWQSGGLFRYRSRITRPPAKNPESNEDSEQVEQAQIQDDEETEETGREDWRLLTNRLSPPLLSRIVGDPNYDVDTHPRWMVTSASTAECDADRIPGLDPQTVGGDGVPGTTGEQERAFRFIEIDLKYTWREGAVGRERTTAALDRSWALGDLIHSFSRYTHPISGEVSFDETVGERQLLGEMQFTFLMVLTMMNYSCLQQWKRILELVLTSSVAIIEREAFMTEFLALLLRQLKRCDDVEGGLFDMDGDDGGAFLRDLLKKLRRSVDERVGVDDKSLVRNELASLEKWVKEEYDWELAHESFVRRGMVRLEDGEEVEIDMNDDDEDEETGEYAPMVVDSEQNKF
ncbi:hypothetical protein N7478_008193 [Penicillium angulare]|uniref:uncharacterized protein n=1 Tax=Penicillium angulare TaxID=116970 RepID=UPI00253FB8EF|nr:uncharacterized protein N7478_008193 [Penicillium angulare]KAJ5273068.1 hypothetical protein N7478_008193 [Penicillium angulare]